MKRFFLFLLLFSSAFAVQIVNHDIKITIKEDGPSEVIEEYLLRITLDEEKTEFERLLKESTSFEEWKEFGPEKTINYGHTSLDIFAEFTKSDFAVVTFKYEVTGLVESIEKIGKQEIVGITERSFGFYDGERIELPYDPPTTLSVLVPSTKEIVEVEPPNFVTTIEIGVDGTQYYRYEWDYRKPFNSDTFRVVYSEKLTLQSQLSIEVIMNDIQRKLGNPINLAAAIIVLAVIIWYRKSISSVLSEAFAGEPTIEE